MADDPEPIIVQKRGIDVTPYLHGIYCTIAGGRPFVNEIVHRKWSEDGSRIWMMLESHNFYDCGPEDIIDVVELKPGYGAAFLEKSLAKDAEWMAKRPSPAAVCPACGQKMAAS